MADITLEPRPECFGCLEQVFPPGPHGLRESPPRCLQCACKTECLRRAVSGEQGLEVHAERLERAYQAGNVGFLERWARQKRISQQKPKGRWAAFWSHWRRAGSDRRSTM
jgi:hypothetical protein